jgi:branched-chain amino acid transport system substrate-binding protein
VGKEISMGKTKFLVMIGLVVVLVAATLLSGACAAPAPEGVKVIKIGSVGPLSGAGAPWGLPEDRGLRMLVDEINAAGGLTVGGETYTFVVISADTKFTVEGAAAAAQKLVTQDEVQYVIGGIDKHETMSLQSVFEPAGVIHFHDGWGAGIVHPEAPHSFRIPGTPCEFMPAYAERMLEAYPNATRWALMAYDTPGMHEDYSWTRSYLEGMGLEVVAEEYFAFDALDFYSLLNKLMDLEVTCIECVATIPQMGLIVKQARELGYTGPFADPAPTAASDIVDIAGLEYANDYVSCMTITSGPLATPEAKAFREEYINSFGVWESNVLDISVAFQIILEAMKEADSVEVEDVLAVLHAGGPFDTIFGPALICGEELHGVNCQVFMTIAPHKIQNGELVPIAAMTAEEQLEALEKFLP